MNAIAAVLMRAVPETQTDFGLPRAVVLFCAVGLLASLCLAIFGLDLSAGSF
jgi:hypothetical protein